MLCKLRPWSNIRKELVVGAQIAVVVFFSALTLVSFVGFIAMSLGSVFDEIPFTPWGFYWMAGLVPMALYLLHKWLCEDS